MSWFDGSADAAVGMATKMPRKLSEATDALLLLLSHPTSATGKRDESTWARTSPTGGYLSTEGAREAYDRTRPSPRPRLRGEWGARRGKDEIVITETLEVNEAALLELIADLVKGKRINGITDLANESDRHGTSVVLELRGTPARSCSGSTGALRSKRASASCRPLLVDGHPEVLALLELLGLAAPDNPHPADEVGPSGSRGTPPSPPKDSSPRMDHIDEVIR